MILTTDQLLTCLRAGLYKAAFKPINYTKLSETIQDKKENPAFLEHFTKALLQYTNLDPETAEGKQLLMTHFFNQCYSDIRANLKCLEKGPFTPQAEVLELAFKVYHARNDKNRNHCHLITMASWPAENIDHLIHVVHAAPLPPPGLKNHQARVSNVVELVTGPKHALILILVPWDLVKDVIGKDIRQLIVLEYIVAWWHQTQKTPKLIF